MGFLNGLFKKGTDYKPERQNVILSPVKGRVVPLESVSDPVFAQGMLGVGVAVIPAGGTVYSPVDGTVEAAFPTGHAVGLKSKSGAEVLIHVGVDTVNLKGEGFKLLVSQGGKVKAGQPLIEFDTDTITAAGYETTTMVLVSNAQAIGTMKILAEGDVEPMQELYCFV